MLGDTRETGKRLHRLLREALALPAGHGPATTRPGSRSGPRQGLLCYRLAIEISIENGALGIIVKTALANTP